MASSKLAWEVVRRDTGEAVATFANEDDALLFQLYRAADVTLWTKPALERTCRTCKWWEPLERVGWGNCGDQDGFVIECPATFACNRWEPKEDGHAEQE